MKDILKWLFGGSMPIANFKIKSSFVCGGAFNPKEDKVVACKDDLRSRIASAREVE